MNKALKVAIAGVVASVGALVVSTTTRTTAGITFSNTLTKAKDGRVVKSTLVPKPKWRGGQTWIITIAKDTNDVDSMVIRGASMTNYVYTDSVWEPFPVCKPYRVTVVPDTVLTTTGRVSTKRDSLTAKTSLCRPYTVAEAAELDSFPESNNAIIVCGKWAYHSTRERDSISIPPFTNSTSPVPLDSGYLYRFGAVAVNRYTMRVRLDSDPSPACLESATEYQTRMRAAAGVQP